MMEPAREDGSRAGFERGFPGAFGFDGFGGRAEMVLCGPVSFCISLLSPHVLILSVGLGQVVEPEALREAEFGGALVYAAHQRIDAPLRIGGGRVRPPPKTVRTRS